MPTTEVVATSTDTVKPSAPTPHHLRHLRLSALDQVIHAHFIPLLYFNTSSDSASASKSHILKNSLSQTLTIFYSLAARLKDHLYIDCNDTGVPFSEATANNCRLSEIVEKPNTTPNQLNKLLPCHRLDDAGDLLLAVRVTVFQCGGIAIGTCFSHKFADGFSIVSFVNCWAAVSSSSSSCSSIIWPRFDLAVIFPPREKPPSETGSRSIGIRKSDEKIVGKRFVFGGSAISGLKAKIRRPSSESEPCVGGFNFHFE